MKPVTKLNESHQGILNDDVKKPHTYKISKKYQGDRFFIDWGIRLDYQSELLEDLTDRIINQTGIKLQSRSVERFRRLAGVILLNLGKCLIQRAWLQIPKRKVDYSPGTIPHDLGFTYRHLVHILDFLTQQKIIYAVKGVKSYKDPQLSAYQPTEFFNAMLALLSMQSTSEFDIELVVVNKQERHITPPRAKANRYRYQTTDYYQ